LGRAIVREPKVFLFDEPLSNLDAKLRVQMRAEIARLHLRLKTTIIYVTHDQVEAMTLGERIVLMDQGEIQQVDTPMKIYQKPSNRFVASFIGSPAMNFISGQVDSGVFHIAERTSENGERGRGSFSRSGQQQSESPPVENKTRPLAQPIGTIDVSEYLARSSPLSTVHVGPEIPNGPAVLGVRPEDLLTRDDGAPLGTVTLDVVEHMGHETIAHFALAGGDHVARLPADAGVQPGDQLLLSIRPGAFHLFSGDDGRRLN
jgi:multiple sugar transport system ATP-binding protein